MSSSTALKTRLESALAHLIPSALTPRPQSIRPVVDTGVVAVDNLLSGGLPVGAISEIVGPECSGRTSLALSLVAGLTAEGKVCAWVDVSDTLSPTSAAAAGVDLPRLLWVRCGEMVRKPVIVTAAPVIRSQMGDVLPTRSTHGGGSPHPRGEVRGLDTAVQGLMRRKDSFVRDKSVGTPGVRNLLLQAGGFAAIVLDLGSLAQEHAQRVPMATWFRYRAAVDKAQASLVLLTQDACAKSSACLVLRLQGAGETVGAPGILNGLTYTAELDGNNSPLSRRAMSFPFQMRINRSC